MRKSAEVGNGFDVLDGIEKKLLGAVQADRLDFVKDGVSGCS